MKVGIGFPYQLIYSGPFGKPEVDPRTAIDPSVIRDWAQAAEGLGYDFLAVADHVLLGDRSFHTELSRPYTHDSVFREPLVMFAFLAAVTTRIQFLSSILIAPQRQTALLAKQAAEVALLSGGRLILGIGNGWNWVEFEALGQDYHRRGRRMEEQIGLLRRFWTEKLVTFEGRFDRVTRAGLNPRPDAPIPIWIGGEAPAALDRVGRAADGWIPRPFASAYGGDPAKWEADVVSNHATIVAAARKAGRDPAAISVSLSPFGATLDEQMAMAHHLGSIGGTHCTFSSRGKNPQEHINSMRAFREAF